MLLVGTTCTQFQLWEAIRSLDYLANHPLVNPKRAGLDRGNPAEQR